MRSRVIDATIRRVWNHDNHGLGYATAGWHYALNGGAMQATGGFSMTINTWWHVALRMQNSEIHVTRSGVNSTTRAGVATIADAASEFRVGDTTGTGPNVERSDGRLPLYDRRLTDDELTTVQNLWSPPTLDLANEYLGRGRAGNPS